MSFHHAPPDARHGVAAARSLPALLLQGRGKAATLLLMRGTEQRARAPSRTYFSRGCSWRQIGGGGEEAGIGRGGEEAAEGNDWVRGREVIR